MNTLEAMILGAVQGLTEFLPVSSSGHLVLFQHLFGIEEPALFFDICLHGGTLLAVVVVFFREIMELLTTLITLPARLKKAGSLSLLWQTDPAFRMAVCIVTGSIPTGILGILFKDRVHQLFASPMLVGGMLILTGALLWMTRRVQKQGRPVLQMTLKDAVVIGVVQGMAIIPGISRSGSTISAALFLGVDREAAGRYSFLLSIPAILGALVLGLVSPELETTISIKALLLGSVVAAIVGWLALVVLLRVVSRGRLYWFAPYCWLAGLVTLVVSWAGR
ncbi:undecaprenyl-diphosphate phosphatase [Desulfosarcina sp. OttesenSCG-928-A07]|nr:undecaprenyl-diphosphate phosphatase [Desulfosarcina sp. OttesenSCG-928-A07]